MSYVLHKFFTNITKVPLWVNFMAVFITMESHIASAMFIYFQIAMNLWIHTPADPAYVDTFILYQWIYSLALIGSVVAFILSSVTYEIFYKICVTRGKYSPMGEIRTWRNWWEWLLAPAGALFFVVIPSLVVSFTKCIPKGVEFVTSPKGNHVDGMLHHLVNNLPYKAVVDTTVV